jgi:hypothetical protein
VTDAELLKWIFRHPFVLKVYKEMPAGSRRLFKRIRYEPIKSREELEREVARVKKLYGREGA